MPIELRILSGSRAGQSESFEKSVIAVGRHPMSDLKFDPNQDIDVSTRHGEIRGIDGRYTVIDNESTNGTFVNGQRVPAGGSRELRSGDVIGFGAHGPTVSVRIADSRTTPVGDRATAAIPTPALGVGAQPSAGPRRPTTERVAIAVAEQTRGLKIVVIGAVLVFGGLGGALYWMGHREAMASEARLRAATATFEQSDKQMRARVEGGAANDTAVIKNLERQRDSLMARARTATGAQSDSVQRALQRHQNLNEAITNLNPRDIVRANNPAVTLIRAEVGAVTQEATGFTVSAGGHVITNRHVVIDASGNRATKVLVKFADTPEWHHAHIAKIPDNGDVDLALLQIDDGGKFPTTTVAPTLDAAVGDAIAAIGFPDGTDLPMDGAKATTSLNLGTVSKTLSNLLQIDSYASHGSSGSPVFDGHGHVIGVIYGGPKDAGGRIVFAVPAGQITELIRSAK